jgi:hypothetical protein
MGELAERTRIVTYMRILAIRYAQWFGEKYQLKPGLNVFDAMSVMGYAWKVRGGYILFNGLIFEADVE